MKKFYLLIVLMGFTLFMSAQNAEFVSIGISPELKQNELDKKNNFNYIQPLSYDKTGMYTLLMPFPDETGMIVIGPKKKYAISKINSSLELSTPVYLDFKEGDKDKTFEFAISIKKTDYVFTSFQNQKLKKTFLFGQSIDKKTMTLKSDLVKIAEIDYSNYNKYKYSNFNFTLSPDSSKILFIYSLLDKNDKILNIGMTVCNNQLKQEWKNDEVTPGGNVVFTFENYAVNNQGDAFVSGRSFVTERDYNRYQIYSKVRKFIFTSYMRFLEKPYYSYKVISITNNGTKNAEYALELPGSFIRQININPVNNKELICTGVYSRPSTYSVVGNCFFKINTSTGEIQSSKNEFTKSLFSNNSMKAKEVNKILKKYNKGKEFDKYQYSVAPVIKRKGGGYYLLIEQFEKMRKTVRQGNTVYIFNAYNYDNILVVSLNNSGETEWVKKVDKHTYSEQATNIYASYKHFLLGDNLYLFYDDLDEKATNFFGVIKRSKTSVAKIDIKGNIDWQKISTAEEDGLPLIPKFTGNFSSNSVLLLGSNLNNKFRLVKVDFLK